MLHHNHKEIFIFNSKPFLTLKDRAPIRTLKDRGVGAYLAPPLSRKLLKIETQILFLVVHVYS